MFWIHKVHTTPHKNIQKQKLTICKRYAVHFSMEVFDRFSIKLCCRYESAFSSQIYRRFSPWINLSPTLMSSLKVNILKKLRKYLMRRWNGLRNLFSKKLPAIVDWTLNIQTIPAF